MTHLAEIFQQAPEAWVAVVFLFSLLIGSFLNVVIHRVPVMLEREWHAQAAEILQPDRQRGSSTELEARRAARPAAPPQAKYNLVVPRSACPKCGAMITALQNIPVLSYLWLKGRCASCGARISVRYPLVELGTAILSALVAWKFGFVWYTAAALVLTWVLIALTAIDIDHQLLPDTMTLPLVWLGLLLSLAPTIASIGLPVDPRASIIGAAAGYLSLWSVYHAFRLLTGKEGMGYGDFKLFAALGAWFGWQMLLLIILLAAFSGAVIGLLMIALRGRDKNIPIPFGPYLAAAGWIALMWGDELVASYLHFAGLGIIAEHRRYDPADNSEPSLLIALTGGIASGKTAVAELFAKLDVPVLDTDQIARDVVAPGMPALGQLVAQFGRKFSTHRAGSTGRACASACSAIRRAAQAGSDHSPGDS